MKSKFSRSVRAVALLATLSLLFLALGSCEKQPAGSTHLDEVREDLKSFGAAVEKRAMAEADPTEDEAKLTETKKTLAKTLADIETYGENLGKMKTLRKVSDLDLPAQLMSDGISQPFGLMIYDGESKKFVRLSQRESLFDESKKTLLFVHGMGINESWKNADLFFPTHNVLCFFWGAFAAEQSDPAGLLNVCDKTWFRDGKKRYTLTAEDVKTKAEWESGDDLRFSVTEILAAHYTDLLSAHPNYRDKEIALAGHSYGGLLVFGLLNYLENAFLSDLIGLDMLPDKVFFCDPYLHDGSSKRHISWLNDMQNPKGGIAFISVLTLRTARLLGVAVTLLRTNEFIGFTSRLLFEQRKLSIDDLRSSALFVSGPATADLGLSESHNYGFSWPSKIIGELLDSKHERDYACGLFNPYHSDFSKTGKAYDLKYNGTLSNEEGIEDVKDDKITLRDPKSRLCGFVYVDKNGNGEMDERLSFRVSGAKITVRDKSGATVCESITGTNGYFETVCAPGEYSAEITLPGKSQIVAAQIALPREPGRLALKSAQNQTWTLNATVEEGVCFTPLLIGAK